MGRTAWGRTHDTMQERRRRKLRGPTGPEGTPNGKHVTYRSGEEKCHCGGCKG